MQKGIIRWLARDRGFGVIRVNGVQDVYFHRSDVQDMPFDLLKEGQSVGFRVSLGPKGLVATKIRVAERDE